MYSKTIKHTLIFWRFKAFLCYRKYCAARVLLTYVYDIFEFIRTIWAYIGYISYWAMSLWLHLHHWLDLGCNLLNASTLYKDCHFIYILYTGSTQLEARHVIYTPAIKWLTYCRYGVKHYSINQPINHSSTPYRLLCRTQGTYLHSVEY